MGMTPRRRLTFRGVGPRLESGGVWHEKYLGPTERQHARDFGELVVVADDGAHLAEADVENKDVPAALVIIRLIAGQMQLPLFADIAVGANQYLCVEDEVG